MSEKREGYQFVGWYIDKECTKRLNPGGVLPHSVTLYDKWIPIWYPIEYDVDGGVMSRRNPRYTCIESEELLLYPAFKKGVMFVGWQLNGEIITSLPAGIHEPVILTAIYKECPVIHFETCGGANYMDICTDEHGLLGDLKPPVRVGYTFDGWFWDCDYRWRYNLELIRGMDLSQGFNAPPLLSRIKWCRLCLSEKYLPNHNSFTGSLCSNHRPYTFAVSKNVPPSSRYASTR